MFNLFPKKKSVDEILEDNGLSPLPYTNVVTFTVDGKAYTADEFIKHYKDLYTENENNKALLKSIEEDGTKEHNEAVKLRQENAQLKVEIDSLKNSIMVWRKIYDEKADAVDELMKEVNGLRHLKKENVDLIERVNEIDSDQNEEYRAEIFTLKNDIAVLKDRNFEILKMYNGMVTQGGLKYMEAKLQIVQNNYKKCAEERDEFKHQLNAANKEIEALKKEYEVRLKELHNDVVDVNNENKALKKEKAILERWKYEQLIVNEMWNRVDSYVRDHDDAPLGGVVANTCLNFLKERDELKKRVDGLSLTIDRKNFEIDDLKAEIKKLKEDIVDYVIEKDDKLDEAKETIDVLKNMKAQGFEDYDSRDFEKDDELKKTQDWNRLVHGVETERVYVCNHCGYKIGHNTNQWGGCACCKDGLMVEKEEAVQKHPMYPFHWGGYDKVLYIDKEIEFSAEELLKRATDYAETTAKNLEEKFDKGEDVLDYFEQPKWICPCNKCKDKRENKDEKTWEEAASDLALKIVKLEKQIEELKIVNICQKQS